MKTFREIKIIIDPSKIEMVSGLLWQADISGIVENDNGVSVFIEEAKSVSIEEIKNILDRAVNEDIINSYSLDEKSFEDKNWNEEYEKKVRVIEVTDKLVIKPSFKEYSPRPGQVIIEIDPKMSFGTGEHATTRLILKLLEKNVIPNSRVLDVGTGTGVLAIASVLLGASTALAIDNDEWCKLNGDENVAANNLQDKVEVRLAEIGSIEETEFDLILANINRHILLEIADLIKEKIKKTGVLILSGLLISDVDDILDCYLPKNFQLLEKMEEDEWCALVFTIRS
ncbi:MAG: 50S ribosomal protein L11 methyltransferase [Melioribacteraceae bacterium]|jgi:ribosomal protein L11 methyltransferase|nr:50S ribosomal protein L11 methyltransferase [Melioribacteraceae bacterium]